jgi:rare lipoprotein A
MASWYGAKHHGKRTANGEIFDQRKFTAAHRTLPWGSIVRVTNLENGKSVEVRINDRGPFTKGRVIDLSRAAARALDMVESGVSPVRMELLWPREMSNDLVLQNSQSRSGNRQ